MYQAYTHDRDGVSNHSWFAYARSEARGSLLVARCSLGCSHSFGARGDQRMSTRVSLQWVMIDTGGQRQVASHYGFDGE